MLISVLKGDVAIKQHKLLIRLFRQMKEYIVDTGQVELLRNYEVSTMKNTVLISNDKMESRVIALENAYDDMKQRFEEFIDQFEMKKKRDGLIIRHGEWFLADVIFNEIFAEAKHTIDIIDPYLGIKTLNALVNCQRRIRIRIWTCNTKELPITVFNDFVRQYGLHIIIYKMSHSADHDRFIFIDNDYPKRKKAYFVGTSFKDAGNSLSVIYQSDFFVSVLKEMPSDLIVMQS